MNKKNIIGLFLAGALTLGVSGCAFDNGSREYEKGVLAYKEKEYSQAAVYFTNALEKNADCAEYYLYYGFTLLEMGEYQTAAEQFEKVIQDKDITMIQENNKRAYRGAGIAYVMAEQPEQALTCFYAALQITQLPELDEDIRSYMQQASASRIAQYRREGNLNKALSLCEELRQSYGDTADLNRMLADIYLEQENYTEALDCFDRAITLGDVQISTRLGKLLALQALGEDEKAQEVSAWLAAAEPKDDSERLSVAIAAFSLQDYERADSLLLPLYEAGVQEAGYYLAQIAVVHGSFETAAEYLTGQLETRTEKTELYYQLAVCMLQLGQTAKAQEYYELLQTQGDVSYTRKQEKLYIAILEAQGRWSEAYELLQQYMENYVTAEDEELEAAERELQFLKTRQ